MAGTKSGGGGVHSADEEHGPKSDAARLVPDGSDGDRFSEFVLPELDVLYRVARSITRDPVDAEDLVQDTLLRAFRSIRTFDGRHPRAWLLTIMRNAQINRTRRRRPSLARDDRFIEDTLESTGPDASVEDAVLDTMLDAGLQAAFDALGPRFQRVVELVDIDGCSYEEAAAVLGVPAGTVMSRLHRARAKMRGQLQLNADAGSDVVS